MQERALGAKHRPIGRQSTVAPGFVKGMLSGLRLRPMEAAALLPAAGVPAECAEGRGPRIPVEQYAALYNGVVRALGDEGFGLFSAPVRPGTFEFLCRGVLGSASLGEALDRAARFLAIVLPDLAVAVRRQGTHATLEIREVRRLRPRPADPARVFAFEWLLRLLHGLACWLADRSLPLDEVRFPYPRPAHATDYGLVYTEHSTFGAESLLATFDGAFLDLPVRRDAADLAAFLEGAPGKISMLYRRDREMVRVVRALLAQAMPRPFALEDAARELHLSARTLHRRLRDEGSSFRAIKDALRRDRALERLERTRDSIATIAADLGYSEPSAFFRAFQGWTGKAPSAWRRRAAARR